jgi:glycosyltransferase involved in cell wall biosynthesis
MRLCIFSEYYAPSLGGVQSRMQGLAEAMTEMGHTVVVVTSRHERNLEPREIINGVQVRRVDTGRYEVPRWKFLRRDFGGMMRYALACRQVASREIFDVLVYGEFPLLHSLMAPLRARQKAVLDWCEFRQGWIFQTVQRRWPRRFRWNMAVSRHVAGRIRALSGREVICLPSGIRTASFRGSLRGARANLLYVGRLSEHKNVGLVLDSFEELCRRGYEGGLTIAGSGPQFAALASRRAASPYAGRIVMTGEVSDQEKISLLSSAELLLLASRREGFPVVVAEAMASGLPCITTEFPENGTVAVVKEYGCGLVATPDPGAVADAVEQGLRDWQSLSAACLAGAATLNCSW